MSAINEVLDAIASRFKSGNSIPVERVHITAAELSRLQSSLAEKDETIAELRARCEATERDAVYSVTHLAEFIRGLTEDDQETYSWLNRRSALLSQADAFIAAQHAQRKEKWK